MRKNFILAIIILIIISSTSTIVFAQSSLNINVVADKSNLKSGEEIIFSMSLSNMEEIDEGVNAYILTLNYNTEQFDFVKAEGANNWNAPMYNTNTNTISTGKIKFVSTISNFTKDENEFLKITLKAKQQLSNNDIDITIDKIPNAPTNFSGFVEKLIIPSDASFNIFFNGYFVFPAKRSCLSYS